MLAFKVSQTICARCLARRLFSTTTSTTDSSQQSHCSYPSSPRRFEGFAANLTNRRLVSIHGRDASHFLQGLATTNIPPPSSVDRTWFYSAFLNAQGRVLHDVFINPAAHSQEYRETVLGEKERTAGQGDDAFLIEVDAGEADRLVAWLKRYKLRAKVTIRKVEDDQWNVWSVWDSRSHAWPGLSLDRFVEENDLAMGIGCVDLRTPNMGYRALLPTGRIPGTNNNFEVEEVSLEQYTLHRILEGVPEGQAEILRETALPAESCIDYMGGINFRKGCYVGQELTIRTHHTGVVRKRILPVRLYSPEDVDGEQSTAASLDLQYSVGEAKGLSMPQAGANIIKAGTKGRSAGKFLTGVGNVGLALCRLEIMTDTVLTGEGGKWNSEQEFRIEGEEGAKETRVKAFVPDWQSWEENRRKAKT